MDKHQVLELFNQINVWKRGDQRAPHKPLLILYALGRYSQGHGRLISYREIDEHHRDLLIEFGPPRKSHHPEYPFWRLQNDGIWTVTDTDKLERRKGKSDAKKSELLKYDVKGGFVKPIYDIVQQDNELMHQIARRTLEEHFPASMHEDLTSAVGLNGSVRVSSSRVRDPNFRKRILQAYEYRCAICGFDLKLRHSSIGLEAAHIKWHQAGGPDTEENGLALCVLHHKLFDRGALHITDDYHLLVSEEVHGTRKFVDELLEHHGEKIYQPQRPAYCVHEEFVGWHKKEVFRGPARYAS